MKRVRVSLSKEEVRVDGLLKLFDTEGGIAIWKTDGLELRESGIERVGESYDLSFSVGVDEGEERGRNGEEKEELHYVLRLIIEEEI